MGVTQLKLKVIKPTIRPGNGWRFQMSDGLDSGNGWGQREGVSNRPHGGRGKIKGGNRSAGIESIKNGPGSCYRYLHRNTP